MYYISCVIGNILYLVPFSLSSIDFILARNKKRLVRIFGNAQNSLMRVHVRYTDTGYIQMGVSVNNLSLVCAAVSAADIISSGPEAEMPPNSPLFRRCNYLTSPPPSSLFDHPLPTRCCACHIYTYTYM